jgi:hypothetical protein
MFATEQRQAMPVFFSLSFCKNVVTTKGEFMGLAERSAIISEIETLEKVKLITYVTSTRVGAQCQMSMDHVRRFYEHLGGQKYDKLALYIHSDGGDGTVPWRLVTLLREHANKLFVYVPFRAFSAGTLTALGADKIYMHPMGMLGPTDPTVSNNFNPTDANGVRQGIGVEDVAAFLALAKEDLCLSQDGQVETLRLLSEQVHPLALGNVKRSQAQSRMMAQKLLGLHMDLESERSKVETIIDSLTSKLYYHGHPINRTEAQQLGLKVEKNPSAELLDSMWRLYLDYEKEMELSTPFRPTDMFCAAQPAPVAAPVSLPPLSMQLVRIESDGLADSLVQTLVVSGTRGDDFAVNIRVSLEAEEWRAGV